MGAETAENLCLGFGCRRKGFFAKVSEYLFHDKDGIPVLATLYSYSDGQLHELDIWKVDFSPLLAYPDKP